MTTSSNARLLIQQIEVYNMSELVHAALHDEDFDHYGVKGMKWYQHIFTKEGRAERRANKPRNKYNSIKDIGKNDFKAQRKYLKSVKRGYNLRRAKKFVRREVVATVLAAVAGVAWGAPAAALTFAANTALNATVNNKVRKNYQELEAAKWMREEDEESRRWSDSAAGEKIVHSAINHYGVKGMKWYQHIFGDKGAKSSKAKGATPKRKKPMTPDRAFKRSVVATLLGGPFVGAAVSGYTLYEHPETRKQWIDYNTEYEIRKAKSQKEFSNAIFDGDFSKAKNMLSDDVKETRERLKEFLAA